MPTEPDDIARGPKGGRKHTPGKGHTRKSGPQKRKRFARKVAKKRGKELLKQRDAWELWESLPDDVKKLRPDLQPLQPRPQ